jgi:hypothetical protein
MHRTGHAGSYGFAQISSTSSSPAANSASAPGGPGSNEIDPVFDLAMGHAVFLSVRRTVSRRMDSTISSSTTLRASSRNDPFAEPCGGDPGRMAITWAS